MARILNNTCRLSWMESCRLLQSKEEWAAAELSWQSEEAAAGVPDTSNTLTQI